MLENIDDELFVELDEKPTNNEASLQLRYDRRKRLEDASDEVKLLHCSTYVKRQSMFSCIWNNKGNKFIFIAIILLVVINLAIYFYNYSASAGNLHGVKAELQSFKYNGELLVNVVFLENRKIKNKTFQMNVILKAFNKKDEEIYASKACGIYIGSALMLHFKIEKKGISKIIAEVENNGKILILSSKM